jgi:hypothetical protein
MKGFIGRHRPSPSMAVALLALSVALGGTGYAAIKLPRNSVGSKQIKRNAVTGAKVKDFSLFANDFAAGQIPKGPTGPPGPKGDRGDRGPIGPSNAYYASKRAGVDLGAVLEQDVNVLTLPGLPAGSYIINAHLTAVKFTAGFSVVRCGIKAAGRDSGGPNVPPSGTPGPPWRQAVAVSGDTTPVAAVVVSMPVSSAGAFGATLYCRMSTNASAFVEESHIEAIKVGSLVTSGDP